MKMMNNKKIWSQPTITTVERLKNAAGGTHTGLSKSNITTEYIYQGPGS